MLIIGLILAVLIVILALLSTIALKIGVLLDTDDEIVRLEASWLKPLFEAEIFMENNMPIIEVFLFRHKIYKRQLKAKRRGNIINRLWAFSLKDVNMSAKYGFKDKFMVGMFCAAFNFITALINADYIEHTPDFTADNDYIYLKASADLDILSTLKNMVTAS